MCQISHGICDLCGWLSSCLAIKINAGYCTIDVLNPAADLEGDGREQNEHLQAPEGDVDNLNNQAEQSVVREPASEEPVLPNPVPVRREQPVATRTRSRHARRARSRANNCYTLHDRVNNHQARRPREKTNKAPVDLFECFSNRDTLAEKIIRKSNKWY